MTTEEENEKKPLSQADRIVVLGLKGGIIATVCLFTPLLTMLLNAIGLGGLAPLLNALMFPLLFVCFGVMGYGMWLKKSQQKPDSGEQ